MSNAETWWKEIRVISTTLQAEEYLFTPQLIPHLCCGSAAPPAFIWPPAHPSLSTSSSSWPCAAPDDALRVIPADGFCSAAQVSQHWAFSTSQPQQQWDSGGEWQSPAFLVAVCLSHKIMWTSRPFSSRSCWLVVLHVPCAEVQFTLTPEQSWKIWEMVCRRCCWTVLRQDQLIPWAN